MPDFQDQINQMTRRYIDLDPGLIDDVYNQDTLTYFMRKSLDETWRGGSSINSQILYDTPIGGGFLKGKQFNLQQKQTTQQMRLAPKQVQVSVPIYMEDFRIFNTGPLAAIDLVKTKIREAYMALGAFTAIGSYLNGVQAGYEANIDGFTEALNDGATNGWDGQQFATYASLTRSLYNGAITSQPISVTGELTYNTVDQYYQSVNYGSGKYEPNLMQTTPQGLSILKSKYQTQQRFQNATIAEVGFRGLEFNGATVLASRYCPGSYLTASAGTADVVAVNYLTETSNGAVTSYPTFTGETLWILNARKPFIKYYVSDDEYFGGGFRDFIPAAGSTLLVGQVLLSHQLMIQPRYHKYLFGFTS